MYVSFENIPTTSSYDCRPYISGNNETCDFPASQPGKYNVMVRAYSAFTNVSLMADHTTTVLGNSGKVENIDVARGEMKSWTVDVPAGASELDVTISGGTGDADLYLKQGSAPSTSSFDCRPYISGNTENCLVSNPASDTYHIGVRGYSAATGVTMNWSYQ